MLDVRLLCFYVDVQCFIVSFDVFCEGGSGANLLKTFRHYLVDYLWVFYPVYVCLRITS